MKVRLGVRPGDVETVGIGKKEPLKPKTGIQAVGNWDIN